MHSFLNSRLFAIVSLSIIVFSGLTHDVRSEEGSRPRFSRHHIPLPPDVQNNAQTRAEVASRAGGLVINATFDKSIDSNSRAADIKTTINSAISFYQSTFTDNVTVNITFQDMTSGLGQSQTYTSVQTYAAYRAALAAKPQSSDDTLALAHLPTGSNEPVTSRANVEMSLPLARVLGFNANPPSGQSDSIIGLNSGACNILATDSDPNKYSYYATVCHEIDEVLGLGSNLDSKNAPQISVEDLFRYDGSGNRSYSDVQSTISYFSIDGTTQIVQFNQDPSGDRGDWYSPGGQTPRVQDAFGQPGDHEVPAEELRALDVVGWTRAGTAGNGGVGGGGSASTINLTADTTVPFSVPATANSGQPMKITSAVINTGNANCSAFWVNFMFSTSAAGTPSDVLIGKVNLPGAAAGASVPVTFSGNCPSIASGNYFVIMMIDPSNLIAETNQNDNVSASANTVAVTGIAPPVIGSDASASPSAATTGQAVTFTVSATDPSNSPLSYAWDFGDGNTGNGASASNTYTASGTYTATVTISDTVGGMITSSVDVQVTDSVKTAVAVKKSFTLSFNTGSDKIDITLSNPDFANITDDTNLTFVIGDLSTSKFLNFDTATTSRGKAVGDQGKFMVSTRGSTVRYTASRVDLESILDQFGATMNNTFGTLNIPMYIMVNDAIYGNTYTFNYSVRGNSGKGF